MKTDATIVSPAPHPGEVDGTTHLSGWSEPADVAERNRQAAITNRRLSGSEGMTLASFMPRWGELEEARRVPSIDELIADAQPLAQAQRDAAAAADVATADLDAARGMEARQRAALSAAREVAAQKRSSLVTATDDLAAAAQRVATGGPLSAVDKAVEAQESARRALLAAETISKALEVALEQACREVANASELHAAAARGLAIAAVDIARLKAAQAARPIVDKVTKALAPALEAYASALTALRDAFGDDPDREVDFTIAPARLDARRIVERELLAALNRHQGETR